MDKKRIIRFENFTLSLEDLVIIASIVRKTIIESMSADIVQRGIFRLFPRSCCEYSSWLLGAYLARGQLSSIVYVGEPKSREKKRITYPDGRHCWLGINNIFIDITADQFLNTKLPVIVEPTFKYYGSTWHERFFEIKETRKIKLYWLEQDDDFSMGMQYIYSAIIERMMYYKLYMEQLQYCRSANSKG